MEHVNYLFFVFLIGQIKDFGNLSTSYTTNPKALGGLFHVLYKLDVLYGHLSTFLKGSAASVYGLGGLQLNVFSKNLLIKDPLVDKQRS